MRFKPRQTFTRALLKSFPNSPDPMEKATTTVNKIPKPVLRGLNQAVIKKNITMAVILATTAVIACKLFRNGPRKRDYIEFYKYYDDEEAFERMRDAGLMQSTPAGDKI